MAPKFGLFHLDSGGGRLHKPLGQPPTRTDANWLTFCDETGSRSLQLQQFATGNFPVSNSVVQMGGVRVAYEIVYAIATHFKNAPILRAGVTNEQED